MSKRVLTVLLALMMAVGVYTAVASAGVDGSFTFDISLQPKGTDFEVEQFKLDFEGLLLLNITISGLTFSNDLAVGVAGIEHYIADISTTLGALDLTDEFWFAAPYASATWWHGWYEGYDVQTEYKKVGDLLFVKKRVDASITLGGLTADTLILFEDVNFSHPLDLAVYDLDGDGVYEPEEQSWGFGMVFTLTGTTVSGIGVESITGICADPQETNTVKKYSASGRVNPNCVAGALVFADTHEEDFTFTEGQAWPTDAGTYRLGRDDSLLVQETLTEIGPGVAGQVDANDTYQKCVTITNTGTKPEWVALYVYAYAANDPDITLAAGNFDSSHYIVPGGFMWGPLCYSVSVAGTVSSGDSARIRSWIQVFEENPEDKPVMQFDVEKINITGITVGPFTIDSYTEFRPGEPWSETVDVSTSLLGMDVVASFTSTNIAALIFDSATWTLSSDYFTVSYTDENGDLVVNAGETIDIDASFPIQGATFGADLTLTAGTGITAAEFSMSIPVTIGTLDMSLSYAGSPLMWDDFSFAIGSAVGGLDFSMDATFNVAGLEEAGISLGVSFSV